jgi:hypothetical protein
LFVAVAIRGVLAAINTGKFRADPFLKDLSKKKVPARRPLLFYEARKDAP